MVLDAVIYAIKMHGKQKRIGGEPYVLHPLEVMKILRDKGFSRDYQLAGLFHDLLEDTNATTKEILALSNQRVLITVHLVTKENDYQIKNYISRIKTNKIAHMVKLADRLHNLLSARVASPKFQEKYIKETEEYYLELAKGTIFESDINKALNDLRKNVSEKN